MGSTVRLVELRVLEGPNLYLTGPAIKLTLALPSWLSLTPARASEVARRIGLPGWGARSDPGAPRSGQRSRFVTRAVSHVTRRLAKASGRRIAVRARPGESAAEVVVAYPWRRLGVAEALGREVPVVLGAALSSAPPFERILADAAARLRDVEPGLPPSVPVPAIPIVAVTGTNGKTTTVRLISHLLRAAGMRVAYTSTDGVFVDGTSVASGDYSGPAGAGLALGQPGVDAVVLEVARGGILLKGIGAAHNDVAVVTNISSDHLGLLGIHTLDQLAEVKASIIRITRPGGWDVLNADDPRVLAMRRQARGRPFLFSMDPDHPALRQVLSRNGRGIAPLDGALALLTPGPSVRPIVALEDVPMTLAGISTHHIQNAMAAAAAGLGLGLSLEAVAEGLRTFVPDAEGNPGRANLFEVEGRVVIVDYAHNEAGMHGLVEIARGLCRPGARISIVICAAGDRTDEVMHALGFVAARGADRVGIAELPQYLRGREPEDVVERLRAGAVDGGAARVPVFPDEVAATRWMLRRSERGDVLAIAALSHRQELVGLLRSRGGRGVGPRRCRQLVVRARGG